MNSPKYIQVLLLLLVGCTCLPAHGQEDLLREFDTFIARENKTFDDRIRQKNKEFADYLKQEWSNFPTHINQPPTIDPDTAAFSKRDTHIPNTKNPPEAPLLQAEKTAGPRTESGQLKISFFGKSLSIPSSRSFIIPINNVSEVAISKAWSKASDIDYSPLLSTLSQYKKDLRLNDWGYLQLVQQAVKTIYAGQNYLDGTLFLTAYLLNQSAYSVKLARINNKLGLLAEINETVYSIPQLKNKGQTWTLLYPRPLPSKVQVYTYEKSLPFANTPISMQLPELPALDGKCQSTVLPHKWQNETIPVEVDKALIDFYATMPQTDFTVYGNSATSKQVKDLCRYLKKYIEGKSETEAASLLLDFVQHTFDYQADTGQFGYEKVFFPDEMFHYPRNDCEDRAIFFCHLIRELLDLPVALVNYPNHIAAAVCFNAPTVGTCFKQNGKEYTLCDPTYINAGIGECMEQFIGVKAKLITL